MIKPFKIEKVVQDSDGNNSVYFTVSKSIVSTSGEVDTKTLSTMYTIEAGKDIDQELYALLERSGWL